VLPGEAILVAKVTVKQVLREPEADLRRAEGCDHFRGQGDAFAHDALHQYLAWADFLWRQHQPGVFVERRLQILGRQIDAKPLDPRERDF